MIEPSALAAHWLGHHRLTRRVIDAFSRAVIGAVDNEIHHRGQGMVYLRHLGITPPDFWDRS